MNMHRNEEATSYVNILFSIRAGWGVNPTSPGLGQPTLGAKKKEKV